LIRGWTGIAARILREMLKNDYERPQKKSMWCLLGSKRYQVIVKERRYIKDFLVFPAAYCQSLLLMLALLTAANGSLLTCTQTSNNAGMAERMKYHKIPTS